MNEKNENEKKEKSFKQLLREITPLLNGTARSVIHVYIACVYSNGRFKHGMRYLEEHSNYTHETYRVYNLLFKMWGILEWKSGRSNQHKQGSNTYQFNRARLEELALQGEEVWLAKKAKDEDPSVNVPIPTGKREWNVLFNGLRQLKADKKVVNSETLNEVLKQPSVGSARPAASGVLKQPSVGSADSAGKSAEATARAAEATARAAEATLCCNGVVGEEVNGEVKATAGAAPARERAMEEEVENEQQDIERSGTSLPASFGAADNKVGRVTDGEALEWAERNLKFGTTETVIHSRIDKWWKDDVDFNHLIAFAEFVPAENLSITEARMAHQCLKYIKNVMKTDGTLTKEQASELKERLAELDARIKFEQSRLEKATGEAKVRIAAQRESRLPPVSPQAEAVAREYCDIHQQQYAPAVGRLLEPMSMKYDIAACRQAFQYMLGHKFWGDKTAKFLAKKSSDGVFWFEQLVKQSRRESRVMSLPENAATPERLAAIAAEVVEI